MNKIEIVDYEQKMRDKLTECDEWLNGKDNAVEELENAKIALALAQEKVNDYTDDNIAQVVAYRDNLKAKLGIVDEVCTEEVNAVEAHDEQVVEQYAVVEIATDEIVEQPLV